MDTIIASLLRLIVGAALLPVWIIMALFLLRGEGGLLKALAFAAGAMTARVAPTSSPRRCCWYLALSC